MLTGEIFENATDSLFQSLRQLRQYLHQHPELSGKEYQTAAYITDYLRQFQPDELYTGLGSGTALVAIWNSGLPGKTIFLRTELDALPITEENNLHYKSLIPGVSHQCGHDGHMTMVAGLAPVLKQSANWKGKVGLLFQAAEETGRGAADLVNDPVFRSLEPEYIFGLHNLPGFPFGEVVLKNGPFCAASVGMHMLIKGRTSHAAEPEKALSPAALLSKLINWLPLLPEQLHVDGLMLLTVTHARLGEAGFGITPGDAILQATLRAYEEKNLHRLKAAAEELIAREASGFQVQTTYEEEFPLTSNTEETFSLMQKAAERTGFQIKLAKEPFRWSEDFGHFSACCKTGFFGLGSGIRQPNLHHPKYDFPDELIPYGINMYQQMINVVAEIA